MKLLPVDRVLLGYLAITSVVALIRLDIAPGAPRVLLANAGVVALIGLIRGAAPGRVGAALSELYPIFLLLALYGALDLLAAGAGITTHDPEVQRWEAGLFGEQVSREWWQRAPSAFWSAVFHADYFTYYLIVPAAPLWFLLRGNRLHLRRVVLSLVATFALCYLIFLFYPVAGPYYEFPRPSGAFLDNAPAHLVYQVLAKGSSYGAAFPSSHVAGVVAATLVTARGSRNFGLVLAVPSLLLLVGVVYCQMHYGVDALAGLAIGVTVAASTGSSEERGASR